MEVRVLAERTLHRGFFQLRDVRLRFERFAGGLSQEAVFEYLHRGEAVGVLLYDPEADAVVLVRQFRIGSHMAGQPGWTVEIVAGACEGERDFAAVARRESLEEAGFHPDLLRPIASFFLSPSGSTEKIHLFLGIVDASRPCQAGGGLAHENEDIAVLVLPFVRAWAMIETGEIDSGVAILALQWLALNRAALRTAILGDPPARAPGL